MEPEQATEAQANTFNFKRLFKHWRIIIVGALVVIAVLVGISILLASLGSQRASLGVAESPSIGYDYADDTSFSNSLSYGGARRGGVPPSPGIPEREYGGVGSYAEESYEMRSYSATVKTHQPEADCATVEAWKSALYVVFETSRRNTDGCVHTFKVERPYLDAVLTELKKLDPSNLDEQTAVVKKQLVRYTSELDILQARANLLEQTLRDVSAAYDELVTLSKDTGDVATLSKVIDSKLTYLERLTKERLAVSAELGALTQRMAELQDRIDYVHLTVTVTGYRFIDAERIKDSWVQAIRSFVWSFNDALESLTVGLLSVTLRVIILVVYAGLFGAVLLVVAKYGWRAGRRFWEK